MDPIRLSSLDFRRETRVAIFEIDSGEFFVAISLSCRNDTQLISIDPTTGAIVYSGRPGIDVFPSEVEAMNYVTSGSYSSVKSMFHAKALIGYTRLSNTGLLLVATKLRASIESLPSGETVYTVVDSLWVKIPLRCPLPQPRNEMRNAADLADSLVNDVHYFCDTRDITRPYPSPYPLHSPDAEFVWNEWLSAPFKDVGLGQHCVVLLKGMCDSRTFLDADGNEMVVALTGRRSRLHPGTRYLARGLNAASSTGNEIECEQLVWPASRQPLEGKPFCSYLWRRGTIPIWWGAEIKSSVQEAEIYVVQNQPPGASKYFQRLFERYGSQERQLLHPTASHSTAAKVTCLNLLRIAPGKPELVLSDSFHEEMGRMVSSGLVPGGKVSLLTFDWHGLAKTIGEEETVEKLWETLERPLSDLGLDQGTFLPQGASQEATGVEVVANHGLQGGIFRVQSRQYGVLRFNCADSLDRTNAASFFGAVHILVEQCRRLGSSLLLPSISSFQDAAADGLLPGQLPPGWEVRTDKGTGKTFYVDHKNRTTTWTHPNPPLFLSQRSRKPAQEMRPWSTFDLSLVRFKSSVPQAALAAMAELFLLAGDVHASVYTGSRAMHSHVLQMLSEDPSKAKRGSAAANMAITLQRRYLNIIKDSSRQKQVEMFLGLRRHKYFPTASDRSLQVLSRQPAFLLKPVCSRFPSLNSVESLLGSKSRASVWVCQEGADVVQLHIYLSEPSLVSALVITQSHGADDATSPGSFDVKVGQYLDDLRLVLDSTQLPRCPTGTPLLYSLHPRAADSFRDMFQNDVDYCRYKEPPHFLYPFNLMDGQLDFLSRVVVVTFYPSHSRAPLTIGQVEVLGLSLLSLSKKRAMAANVGPGTDEVAKSVLAEDSWLDFSGWSGVEGSAGDLVQAVDGEMEEPSKSDIYVRLLQNLRLPEKSISFSDALKLEISRLALGLTCSQRDSILLSARVPPLTVDPNFLLPQESARDRRNLANHLAVGARSMAEDRELSEIGFNPTDGCSQGSTQELTWGTSTSNPKNVDDFLGLGDCCSASCQVQWHPNTDLSLGPTRARISAGLSVAVGDDLAGSVKQCMRCQLLACPACRAPDSASILEALGELVNGSVGTATGPSKGTVTPDSALCQLCCPDNFKEASLLDTAKQKAIHALRLEVQDHSDKAAKFLTKYGSWDSGKVGFEEGEVSLADYPYAGFLFKVPTAGHSAPAESLLSGAHSGVWQAPYDCRRVDMAIVLSCNATVSKLVLQTGPNGFLSPDHAPEIRVLVSSSCSDMERTPIGRWNLRESVTRSFERNLSSPTEFTYELVVPSVCRIVWLEFKLPTNPGWASQLSRATSMPHSSVLSSAEPSSPMIDLLTSDFDAFSTNGSASLSAPGAVVGVGGGIFAERIRVYGRRIGNKDEPVVSQGLERLEHRSFLEQQPKLTRIKVNIDSERCSPSGRIMEHTISLQNPVVSGIRVDALQLCALALSYMASPQKDAKPLKDAVEGKWLLERIPYHPTTFLNVYVKEEFGEKKVAQFQFPLTKSSTLLYFDFPVPQDAKTFVYELVGESGIVVDEGWDGTEPEPLSGSLSLANKIKPYRYVPSIDLGAWGGLMISA